MLLLLAISAGKGFPHIGRSRVKTVFEKGGFNLNYLDFTFSKSKK